MNDLDEMSDFCILNAIRGNNVQRARKPSNQI